MSKRKKNSLNVEFEIKLETSVEEQDKLNEVKEKLLGSVGSSYGISIQDAVQVLLAENKKEVKKVIKKYMK